MEHTCHSRVFSSVARLLALLEGTTEAPHWQVAKRANHPFLMILLSLGYHDIDWIQMRRNGISSGVLHTHHSVLKLFGSDSQALEASTCHCTPFCSVPFWLRLHRKRSLERGLFCLEDYNTWSVLYDGPKVSCCSYVIIVRTLIQLLHHYRPY